MIENLRYGVRYYGGMVALMLIMTMIMGMYFVSKLEATSSEEDAIPFWKKKKCTWQKNRERRDDPPVVPTFISYKNDFDPYQELIVPINSMIETMCINANRHRIEEIEIFEMLHVLRNDIMHAYEGYLDKNRLKYEY